MGDDSPTTIDVRSCLSVNLRACDEPGAAVPVAKLAYEAATRIWGATDVRVTPVVNEYARSLVAADLLDQADQLLREQLAIRRARGDALEILEARNDLARVLTRQGHLAEARQEFESILEAARSASSVSATQLAVFRRSYALCLQRLARMEAAETELSAALAVFKEALAPQHSAIRSTLHSLVALYAAWGRPDVAARYRKQLEEALR